MRVAVAGDAVLVDLHDRLTLESVEECHGQAHQRQSVEITTCFGCRTWPI
jgi:hypothetical protein